MAYASAIGDFHVQAVGVEQRHAHKWRAAYSIGFCMQRLTVPKYRNLVYSEANLRVVSQGRAATERVGQPQLRDQCRRQGQGTAVAGVDYRIHFPHCPSGPWSERGRPVA